MRSVGDNEKETAETLGHCIRLEQPHQGKLLPAFTLLLIKFN
jgi:hypothetical protein